MQDRTAGAEMSAARWTPSRMGTRTFFSTDIDAGAACVV